jgi:hypothetical protein
MSIVHHYFYSSISLIFRFQKKLYPYLIGRSTIHPVTFPSFGFEDFPQDVISVILSYMNISSARTMLPASNVFYFKTRGCLTRCHESVFEIFRNSFIEQLLPLFTGIKDLEDKRLILGILCKISTKSIDHALDPLSIANTFKLEEELINSQFVHQFGDLIYGLYPFAPCISTRECYYLVHSFILHSISPTISHIDPLKPFEQAILSNKFSFAHFLGYMDILLPLMKGKNLTAFALGQDDFSIRYTFSNFNYWGDITLADNETIRLFYLCLKDISCVLTLLNVPLTNKQFDTIVQKVLNEK